MPDLRVTGGFTGGGLMLDTDYEQASSKANASERAYLEAVRVGDSRERLVELATELRDRWADVAGICALGEDTARGQIDAPSNRHRPQAVHGAWLDRRNWAVLGEDASARGDFAAALMTAHRGVTVTSVRTLRLVSIEV
jgi:hypothetical protein